MKIVYVRWLDAALTPEWTRADDDNAGLSEIDTVGYLIGNNRDHIRVAQSNFGEYKYSGIQAIPRGSILKMRTIAVSKPRGKSC